MNFALQPYDKQGQGTRTITLNEMRLPNVNGTTVRMHWNTSPTWTDATIARVHAAGDKYTILVCSPAFLGGKLPTEQDIVNAETGIKNLAARYANNPACWGVHGWFAPNGHSEELYGNDQKKLLPAFETANKRLASAWAKWFPTQYVILAVTPQDPNVQKRIIDHLIAVAPSRAIVKVNILSPKMITTGFYAPNSISHVGMVKYAVDHGADPGWEMLQPSNHPDFGGTGTLDQKWQQMLVKKHDAEVFIGKKAIYWAVYPDDLSRLK